MRLIHCSDLHLGARMTAHLDARAAKIRREELLMTFGNIVETAKREGARAVLIAGDLFDTERALPTTREYVGQLIVSCPDICFVYVSGNHDRDVQPIFPQDVLPPNWVDLTGDAWSSISLCEGDVSVTVSGTSGLFCEEIYASIPRTEQFHIAMLHGEAKEGGAAGKDRVLLSRLADRGIHYLALGHYHSYRRGALGRTGVWCYCGCPEGRGYDECGVKGVVAIELTSGALGVEASYRFLPLAGRTLHRIQVDLRGCEQDAEMLARIRAACDGIPDEDMVSLELCGELVGEYSPSLTLAQQALSKRFFSARVENATRLLLQPEEYLHDISLKGEFIRTVMASDLPPEERDRIILCGLRALRGEEAEL